LPRRFGSRIDLAAPAFDAADLRRDLLRQQTHCAFRLAGVLSPASEDVMNLGQRERELLSLVSARHALIFCLPGALKVAMIRGLGMVCPDWIMLALSGTAGGTRRKAWAWTSDSAHSNLAASGFSLAWAARFAACRGFAS
jgi:hypothetical protein